MLGVWQTARQRANHFSARGLLAVQEIIQLIVAY